MLSNTVMKELLFVAWKDSSRPKIGQFEYFKKEAVVDYRDFLKAVGLTTHGPKMLHTHPPP